MLSLLKVVSIILGLTALIGLFTPFSLLENIAIGLFIWYFFDFITRFGTSTYLILDLIGLIAILTWLIIPLASYYYFNESNALAVLWVRTMKTDSEKYYSYVLPATIAMIIGLRINYLKKTEFLYSFKNREFFIRSNNVGMSLILIGALCLMAKPLIPISLAYIFYLGSTLIFPGILYWYFSHPKPKKYVLLLGILFLMLTSIRSGMFGEMIYILALTTILLSIGSNFSLKQKLIAIAVGLMFIIIIQSVKFEYRKIAWIKGADISLFTNLVLEKITNPATLIDENTLFRLTARFNQGFLISEAMYKVPNQFPFANGETIWQSIAGIIVPRILWRDKPKAGGEANLERFLGIKNLRVSMNIGSIGEGYCNFGAKGGIIFMFFYGLIFNYFFTYLIKIANKKPTYILWLPTFFFYAVVVETDMFTTLNSLFKTGIFVAIIFLIYSKVLKTEL